MPAPARAIAVYLALVCLVIGALCWTGPQLLFGPEGYRTVARAIIGALGCVLLGTGAALLWAVWRGRAAEVAGLLRALVLALSGGPAVMFYNAGAMEALSLATGINIFLAIAIELFLLLAPATLALLKLRSPRV